MKKQKTIVAGEIKKVHKVPKAFELLQRAFSP